MDNIPPCGTPWVLLGLNKDLSRGTFWARSCSLWFCIKLLTLFFPTVIVPSFYSIFGTLMMVLLQVLKLQLIMLFFSFSRLVPPLGLRINATKCQLISRGNLDGFPADMKMHYEPNFEILGAPIGDVIFCAKFLAQKRAKAVKLLSQLSGVGSLDPQIALLLLRQCASFCKLVHLARSTPPSLVSEGLALFDEEVRCHFSDCVAIDASD